jgi:pSer/pThr/pTyr-binding forkhead associated (FHA) protein
MFKPRYDHPVLFGQAGPLNGMRWTIDKPLTIGRDAECDIVIPDRQVSRFHARVTYEDQIATLEDLSSKNGTYCNGQLISEAVSLGEGDLLQVALVQTFVYLSSDATMPMEPGLPVVEKQGKSSLMLDERSRRVWIKDKEVLPPLSVPQFRLLKLLYDNHGKVASRQDLISTVWENEEAMGVSDQALDALVRRLRDRLAILDPRHEYIITVRGYGLRLDNPVE